MAEQALRAAVDGAGLLGPAEVHPHSPIGEVPVAGAPVEPIVPSTSTTVASVTQPLTVGLALGIAVTGVYGGYFGAAQGVLLVGLLGSLLPSSLQQVNAVKNLLSLIVNSVAAVVFVLVARDRIDWAVVGVIALGTLVGGVVGSRVGRRLPPAALRAVIAVVGVVAIARIVTG